MSRLVSNALVLVLCAPACHAQISGNAGGYASRRENNAASNERAKHEPTPAELRPDNTSTFIEASILMNVAADEYVALFGVAHEGATLADANTKMEATLAALRKELSALGVQDKDVSIDFVNQNRIYGYQIEGNIAKEQAQGFEVKKNVSVRFKDKALLDKITLAAARVQVFDLIKMDYVVVNAPNIQQNLRREVSALIKGKAAQQQAMLGMKLTGPTQIVADKPSIYYPVDQYNSYTASESENIRGNYDRNRFTVQEARKSRTFYFAPLDGDGFDAVINPVVTEPVVQFTMYLKVRYEPTAAVKE